MFDADSRGGEEVRALHERGVGWRGSKKTDKRWE